MLYRVWHTDHKNLLLQETIQTRSDVMRLFMGVINALSYL